MLDQAEFGIGDPVGFWTGETFQRAWIYDLQLNPVTKIVEYKVTFGGTTSKGKYRRTVLPYHIRQSKHFDKSKI
ncbi:hypothetical protein vBAmePPT11V19_00053 [Alteromonas phage vB_AmeP_PT11-V19]|nr:hypothetical protein vBAmePPT11V19_00053 [Alteromonas phage vB_AmeP_PT11-V19]